MGGFCEHKIPFEARTKVDNFFHFSVQLMRTGPFVDYNLMIAFSDSAVNGSVSYIFSPPRAAQVFVPSTNFSASNVVIFSFSSNFINVLPPGVVRFCPKL